MPATDSHVDCLFCRIVRGEIPSRKVYEDDEILGFHDIQPAAALHYLLIPKAHVENLYSAEAGHEAVLGRMLTIAARLARENGSPDGFRIVVNNGRVGGQEVYHLHIHVLGGPEPLRSGIIPK